MFWVSDAKLPAVAVMLALAACSPADDAGSGGSQDVGGAAAAAQGGDGVARRGQAGSAEEIHADAVATDAAMGTMGSDAASGGAIVLRMTGPSQSRYPAGHRFRPGETIDLQEGDRIVVLQDGKSRTIAGPGHFGLNLPGARSAGSSLDGGVPQVATMAEDRTDSQTAAVRRQTGPAGPGSQRPGNIAPNHPVLVRPTQMHPIEVRPVLVRGAASGQVQLPTGTNVRPLEVLARPVTADAVGGAVADAATEVRPAAALAAARAARRVATDPPPPPPPPPRP